MQELVERKRVDARHRVLRRDQPFIGHVDGDLQRGLGGALAVARLEHPELAALDGELHVLHVAVMLLEHVADAAELREGRGHRGLHRGLVGFRLLAGGLGDVLGRADAGDHVLALGVDQELAIELGGAGRGAAREGDAGGRGLAHIAEHHRLDIDGGAPARRYGMQLAVFDGARIHPRAEHGADRAPELLARILREGLAALALDELEIGPGEGLPVLRREIRVLHMAAARFHLLERVLEDVMLDAEHDGGVHLDEAAIAVIGEARILGLGRQAPRRPRRSARD